MANFDRSGMTQAGINLMGKAIGGATIQFTKLVLGDGEMTGEILDLQGVASPKQNVDVTRIERNDNQCTVGGELLTSSVKQGFFWRECGLYAMDPDVGEILYNYAYSKKPDYIAQSDSGMMEEILVSMIATVGSNTNVDVTIDSSMVFTSKKEFTPVQQKADDAITLSSSQYDILGDGTDETSKVQRMIADAKSNSKLVFDKHKEIVVNGTSLIRINNKHNIVIEGLTVTGTSENLFWIHDGSSHITFRDCYFKNIGQVILLLTCENITIDNCVFDTTGYGVIQQVGHVSNNIKVINCIAKNMRNDFVECNCERNNQSKNWTITNNHFLGCEGYPQSATEKRFVGVTWVENIIISNNIVEKTCGDGAIHLEGGGGEVVIANNIFDNCIGLYGYLYLLNSGKTTVITGNIFKRTDTTIGVGNVLNLGSGMYSNEIVFGNNMVIGTDNNLIGLEIASQENTTVVGNAFVSCSTAIVMLSVDKIMIASNKFRDNLKDISADASSTSSQSCGRNVSITGNYFAGTRDYCIKALRNNNGTNQATDWIITGNLFCNDVVIYDGTNCLLSNNTQIQGKKLTCTERFQGSGSNSCNYSNMIRGVRGILNFDMKTFNSTNVPSDGNWNKGDEAINTNPVELGDTGSKYFIDKWKCIEAGTPGRWVEVKVLTGN